MSQLRLKDQAPLEGPMSIEELRRTADRWDLLTHSFYRRWTRGELSREELQDYACQYHLVVSAMPRWLSDAANRDVAHRDVLAAHARDEAAHIKLWADFALAVGVMPDELDRTVPNEATRALLARGDALVAGDRGAAVV